MAGKARRSRASARYAGGHQRSWLWGRHAVLEVLRAGRWPVRELLISESTDTDTVAECRALAEGRIQGKLTITDAGRITQLCGQSDHQGLAARMGVFPTGSLDELGELIAAHRRKSGGRVPLLVVLCDRIQDAHNFGAILRNCDATAVDAVVISGERQARITPHVARASAGAVNYLRIFETGSLSDAAALLRSFGIPLLGASEKPELPPAVIPERQDAVLVVGSESTGIAAELLAACDGTLRIPMLGRVESLNAAVATGILLYDLRRLQGVLDSAVRQ